MIFYCTKKKMGNIHSLIACILAQILNLLFFSLYSTKTEAGGVKYEKKSLYILFQHSSVSKWKHKKDESEVNTVMTRRSIHLQGLLSDIRMVKA